MLVREMTCQDAEVLFGMLQQTEPFSYHTNMLKDLGIPQIPIISDARWLYGCNTGGAVADARIRLREMHRISTK